MTRKFFVDCWDDLKGRWVPWTRLPARSWWEAEATCKRWNPGKVFRAT
jgi:hypothetical protein